MKKTNYLKSSLMILLMCFGFVNAWGQASLPVNEPASGNLGSLGTGFTYSGLGTYSGSLKFDTQGDWLQLYFEGNPGELSFDLGVNNTFPGSIPSSATFTVQESINGSDWVVLEAYSNVSGGTKTLSPNSTSRYIRWIYSIKPSGTNIALKNISLEEGEVSTEPYLSTTPSSLTLFSYVEGNGPSASQSFTLDGGNLDDASIELEAPEDFEISLSESTGYADQLTIDDSDIPETIYVRLKDGLTNAGSPYSGNITITGGGTAEDITVSLTGTVVLPPPANDECENATGITVNGGVASGTLENSTNGGSAFNNKNDVWYTFTPTYNETYTITVSNYSDDVDVELYEDNCPSTDDELVSSAATPGNAPEVISEELLSGTTYYIRVLAWSSAAQDSFDIEVTAPAPPADCQTPTEAPTSLVFDTVGSSSISGSFTAAPDADSYLIVISENASLGATPSDGVMYAINDSLGNGTVLQSSSSTTFSATGLNPLTTYYFFVFGYNGIDCGNGPVYSLTVLSENTTTSDGPALPEAGKIFITEVADASNADNEYLEIYNNSDNEIDLDGSKIKMLSDNTIWTFGNQLTSAIIPARGFLILTRNANQSTFESAFGTLSSNTVLVKGTNGQFFGTGSQRRWQLLNSFDEIIDDTDAIVAGSGKSTYQNIFTGAFTTINNTSSQTPGKLEYLVYGDGNWTNSIAADATTSDKNVYIYGDLTITDDIQAKEFGLAENGSVTIADGGSLTLSGKLTNEAAAENFIVQNGGNLIQTSAYTTNDNEGAITVMRDSRDIVRLDYAMWSSPVKTQGLRAFSPETLYNRIYTYKTFSSTEGDHGYDQVFTSNGADTYFTEGKGYLFRAPNNWEYEETAPTGAPYEGSFVGEPFNGNINVNVFGLGGFTSIGNPYASNIRVTGGNSLYSNNSSVIDVLYFWNNPDRELISDNGTPDDNTDDTWGYTGTKYVTCATGGCTKPGGDFISTGQGFIVRTLPAAPENSQVNFSNDMRVNDATQFMKNEEAENHRFWLALKNKDHQEYNQILVGYMQGATNNADTQIDAQLFGYDGSALYNLINEEKFVIQGRALPFESSDIVPLGFKAAEAGKFTVSLTDFDGLFSEGQVTIYLKDKALNITHNLMDADYTFESSAGEFKNRFEIVYGEEGTMNTSDLAANPVWIYKNDKNITVESKQDKILSVELFDLQGRNLHRNNKVNSNKYSIRSQSTGVLIVRVQTQNGEIVSKKIIN